MTTRFNPDVIAHFHASAALYKVWSPEGHLHFGYWKWPMNPFNRSAMLEELIQQAVGPMQLQPNGRIADLGCGYGSSARWVAQRFNVRVEAFTVVEEQVSEGTRQCERDGLKDQVTLHLADFRQTGLADSSLDGAYAIESLCYGEGPGKNDVLREIARILKPGARLAIADGFLMKPSRWRRKMVETVSSGWAVPGFPQLDAFVQALSEAGFTDIQQQDWRWPLGPSALHGFPLMLWTLLNQLIQRRRMTPLEKAHLRSCMLGILMGAQHDLFQYRYILATRR